MCRFPPASLRSQGKNGLLEGARASAEALPKGRLVLVPGAGHMPFAENPEAFFRSVNEYLSEAGPVEGRR